MKAQESSTESGGNRRMGEETDGGSEPVSGEAGSWVNERHTKCVLASGANTGSPIYVSDIETGERRKADLGELEALQGAVIGASTAHSHF